MDESVLVEDREMSLPGDGIGLTARAAEILETPSFTCVRNDLREDVAVHTSIREGDLAEDVTRLRDDPDLLPPRGSNPVFPLPDDGGRIGRLRSGNRGGARCACSAVDQEGGREFADAIGEIQARANDGCRCGSEYSNCADSQGSRNGRRCDGGASHAALAVWPPDRAPVVAAWPRVCG